MNVASPWSPGAVSHLRLPRLRRPAGRPRPSTEASAGWSGSWAALTVALGFAAAGAPAAAAQNSLGIKLIELPAGTFQMGRVADDLDRDLCFTESPSHVVHISQPFRIGETEVTVEHYRQFRPDFPAPTDGAGFATGVSWHDAVAFCEWLSRREGLPYRLPTEAEWEYAALQDVTQRPLNLLSGPLEWCLDWFGDYPGEPQTDPVGPAAGLARVVRGGCLDQTEDAQEYAHPTHRAGMGPACGVYPGAPGDIGRHPIGFRVVQAEPPPTEPWPESIGFMRQGVGRSTALAHLGPNPDKPYFRKRHLLPMPPDNSPTAAIDALGLHPSFRRHNHSPALTVCPNGDVLMVTYTSYREYEPEVSLIATRLRHGADEWDMPSPLVDFPAVNDHAPLLSVDGDTIRLFWGNPLLKGAFPFQWIESRDQAATWCEPRFPHFEREPGPHSRQPINSCFRAPDGVLHLASDAAGGTSVLWASADDGRTWRDPDSRSAGRHTAYCLLSDGGLLGMGGKNTDIDGFMPAVISRDGGRTWNTMQTAFPAQSANQRPSLLRLRSGRLFFAGDYQSVHGKRPAGVTASGSYVALSDDDGQSWHAKPLAGAQPHENRGLHGGNPTVGYSAAAQAPNGVIHLITTMNDPCLHFELNEAWILAPDTAAAGDETLMRSAATAVPAPVPHRETDPEGRLRLEWNGGEADDGRYLRHGREAWFYPDGRLQYEATYHLGRKTGPERFWGADGSLAWQWLHGPNDVGTWTQFAPDGSKRFESRWRGKLAEGIAVAWDERGLERVRVEFKDGVATSLPRGRSRRSPDGARIGARCYVDRDFRISSLPEELIGGDLILTANEDDYSTSDSHIRLDLPEAASVYVCYWAGAHDLPDWLEQPEWKRLAEQATVAMLGDKKPYSVFARPAATGPLPLGGNERDKTGAASMYFVVVQQR